MTRQKMSNKKNPVISDKKILHFRSLSPANISVGILFGAKTFAGRHMSEFVNYLPFESSRKNV